MVARGDYGPVLILRGDHQGTVGYYDDDEGGRAVVYLGEPFVSDPVLLSRGTLQKIDAKSTELEKWKRRYPWLAKQLGCREGHAFADIPDTRGDAVAGQGSGVRRERDGRRLANPSCLTHIFGRR